MESWQKGRSDIFEELTKICNRIEGSISSELNNNTTTRIGIEELRILRENSNQVEKLVEQNAQLVDELERCRVASSQVEVLEKENQRLAVALAQEIQQRVDIGTPSPFAMPVPSRIPTNTPGFNSSSAENMPSRTVPWEQHKSLIEKYNKLSENWADLKRAREVLERSARTQKQNAETWKESYEEAKRLKEKKDAKFKKQREELEDLRARLNIHSTSFSAQEVTPIPPTKSDPHQIQSSMSESTKSRKPPNAEDLADLMPLFSQSDSLERHQQNYNLLSSPRLPINTYHANLLVEEIEDELIVQPHTSSTQEDSDPISPQKIKIEQLLETPLSDDTPIVISSRSVKKRKHYSDTTRSTPLPRIKIEKIISSSPIAIASFPHLNTNESIDLDDIGEKVDTPRKRREVPQASNQINRDLSYSPQSKKQGKIRGHAKVAQYSIPQGDSHVTPVRRVALQSRSTNECILPRTSVERPSKKRRIIGDKQVGNLVEDGELDIYERSRRHSSELSDRLFDLLEKPSPKSPVLSTGFDNHSRRRNRVASGLVHELMPSPRGNYIEQTYLGDKSTRTSSSPSRPSKVVARNSVETPRPAPKGFLWNSPENVGPASKVAPGFSFDPPRLQSHDLINQTIQQSPDESGYFSTTSAKGTASNFKNSSRLSSHQSPASSKPSPRGTGSCRSNVAPEIESDEEPLRARSLNKLSLRDFKVNPSYNQGYDYAFTEVVRGAQARKCLQGCIRPDCCGPKFRALAEITRNPNIPPTASQEERDDILLEDFMGNNSYKIRNMSKAERDEAILQAKTRELANKMGKHRHAYERKASPPGFWRVDFPTTQEQEEDRERAREQERETVAQRYAEAMRPGGAYIFRDE